MWKRSGNLAYAYRDYGCPRLSVLAQYCIRKPDGYPEQAVKSIPKQYHRPTVPPACLSMKYVINTSGGKYKCSRRRLNVMGKGKPSVQPEPCPIYHPPCGRLQLFERSMPNYQYRKTDERNIILRLFDRAVRGSRGPPIRNRVHDRISVKFLAREYPYKPVLLENQESIPYDLKNIGYSTHATTNHRGAFYGGRNKVFPNLGSDTLRLPEYMNNVVKTAKTGPKDGLLTDQMIDAKEINRRQRLYLYYFRAKGICTPPSVLKIRHKVTKAPSGETEMAILILCESGLQK